MIEHSDIADIAQRRHKSMLAVQVGLAANILLAVLKAVVGVVTGSLGILAEALHSGLDLVAALITLVAVRVSGKPADREHRQE